MRCWNAAFAVVLLSAPAFADQPGERVHLRPADMPKPFATTSAVNPPATVKMPDPAPLKAPQGFRINPFATGLSHARWLLVASNGDVLLAETRAGKITLLRDADGDGAAETVATLADGLDRPHGLAVQDGHLYVGEPTAIKRAPYKPGDTRVSGFQAVTQPGALGDGSGHHTRGIVFSRDGSQFLVAVGSRSNIAEEPEVRASVQSFGRDGSGQRTLAGGLRNPVGIAFYPGTDDLYVVVNERDGLGDGLVPDYLARVEPGAFYGWPYAYVGANADPEYGKRKPELVAKTRVPEVLFRSHSAPLGLVFYDGSQFPAEYRGDAFVALHGSWNAGVPTGYLVARVPFKDGKPQGHYEHFLTGFRLEGADRARVWGRPAGLAQARDGSLLVADDVAQAVWRVSYRP